MIKIKSWNFCEILYIKHWKPTVSVVKKYTANKNSSVKKTKKNRLMLLPNCAVCCKRKSSFIKKKRHFKLFIYNE